MIHTVTYTAWKWQFGWNQKYVCRWNFRTAKIHTAAVHTHFVPNRFQKYQIISVHRKRCTPGTQFT